MILHRYIAGAFLRILLFTLAGFALIVLLIDLVEQVRRMEGTGIGFRRTLDLALLHTPQTLYELLPLIVVLATVALFVTLARRSELVVSRASGRAALVSVAAPVAAAFVVGVVALAILNPFVAATSKRHATLEQLYRTGGASTLSLSAEGIWLRQGDADGQTVIRASRGDPSTAVFHEVSLFDYAATGGLTRRIEAREARLVPGAWDLRGVKLWPLSGPGNPEGMAEEHASYRLPSPLTPDRIRDSFGQPSDIAIWDLPAYTETLRSAGFSTRKYQVWMQSELARPVFLMAMVLIAAAFTLRHARPGRIGLAVLTSVLMGFALHYIKNFAQILGENGQLPVLAAAWAPPLAGVLLALGLILQLEDG